MSSARVSESDFDRPAETEHQVGPLELFFDLVFVFAITQVTGFMSADPTWPGLGKGLMILAALWFAWAAYAWLTSAIEAEEGSARIAIFFSMAAMLVAALAVPGAFDSDGVLFGVAYLGVRAMHVVLYAEASPDIDAREAIIRLARTAIPAPALLVLAGFLDGDAQIVAWLVALGIDYAGPYLLGVRGFVVSPAHFAERFGLIVIIALGESIVAIGVGAAGIELHAEVVIAAVLGLALAAALWWAYFDVVAIVARRRFAAARGHARAKIARDSYSYLHLPMIAGIVLVALGIKKALAHVDEPLDTVPAAALCGGVALYLLGHIGFRLRNVRSLNRQRLVAAFVALALIPLADRVDAVVALGTVTAVGAVLIGYEAMRFREARARVREAERAAAAP
jgi:low temperature requirement protein LtrA